MSIPVDLPPGCPAEPRMFAVLDPSRRKAVIIWELWSYFNHNSQMIKPKG